ncbi:osteomodulin [Denticeps clupeoides]|uniref:LRRNT domain-containing protein n=1 Tax=Denticeps clupeoides TaxID=299321 RepID=A0AAY4CCY8_9TELE|nr:osteomodulin [Denticeps clupeoides]
MCILDKWPILVLLIGSTVICQEYDYAEYDTGTDALPEHEFLAPQPSEYVDPQIFYTNECASECFCPPAYPFAMYCDHRKLKAIPGIPRHIRHLYIQFNDIEEITVKPFANSTSLREINLSHNKLKSALVERGVFAKLSDLIELHLEHNDLEEVPPSLPKTIQRLYMGFNRISKVSADTMKGLSSISILDLCNNRLTDAGVKGKILSGMKNLQQITMCGNKLKSMPSDLPTSVLQLSLENNSIASIPEGYFRKTPHLMSIRLSYNKLKSVPYTVFNLSNLMELNLGHNQLSRAFFIPKTLEHLYINHNDFKDVNVSLMCPSLDQNDANKLTYIRLDNNMLKGHVDYYVYRCFPQIQIIFYGEQMKVDTLPKKPEKPMMKRKNEVNKAFEKEDY